MKLSLANTVIGVATVLFPGVNADNTPNLCTAGITNLVKIKPSDASGLVPPNITVGGFEYNGDAEHFVIGSASSEHNKRVLVYLPGTTDRPELSNCLLKSVIDKLAYPTIGLSYVYLSSCDSFHNGKYALVGAEEGLTNQLNYLIERHNDPIDGGTYGSTHFKDDKPF